MFNNDLIILRPNFLLGVGALQIFLAPGLAVLKTATVVDITLHLAGLCRLLNEMSLVLFWSFWSNQFCYVTKEIGHFCCCCLEFPYRLLVDHGRDKDISSLCATSAFIFPL